MILRQYRNEDCDAVSALFYKTVHTVNAKDYTQVQLSAWASDANSLKARRSALLKQRTMIAEIDGVIVGFGSIDDTGYLDLLFVHKDYQRQGIATALCNELEKGLTFIKTFASITAKSFFEKRGYIVVRPHEAERLGVKLKNYEMRKSTT